MQIVINLTDEQVASIVAAITDTDSISPIQAQAEAEAAEEATSTPNLPWDDRIHSSTKATNADGSWRYKRNVDKKLIAKVEKELAALPPAAPAPPLPSALALPLPAPVEAATPYTEFVKFIVANTAPNGRLTDEWVKAALLGYGVPEGSMQNLAHSPQLIPTIHAAVKQALGL